MHPDSEIRRLLDVMPASSRMFTKLKSDPQQRVVIVYRQPQGLSQMRSLIINLRLWLELSPPQRDLLLFSALSWQRNRQWLKPGWRQGLMLVGLLGTAVEWLQADAIGMVIGLGLSLAVGQQLWRDQQSVSAEIAADAEALQIAQRRGYIEPVAAEHLLQAITTVAQLENRSPLGLNELIRCQMLREVAGSGATPLPQSLTEGLNATLDDKGILG